MNKVIILLLLLASNTALAIGRYQPGDTLYVWAVSGLILRAGPTTSSAKLITVPYGTALIAQNVSYGDGPVIIEATPMLKTDSETIPAIQLRGKFAKVSYEGKDGYLFDGYLSKLAPFRLIERTRSGNPIFEADMKWASRNFGLIQHTKTKGHGLYQGNGEKSIFGNGFLFDLWTDEKSGGSRYVLPDISMEELWLIFNAQTNLFWIARPGTLEDYWISYQKISDYEWSFQFELCNYIVRYLPNERIAIISYSCSC